MKTNTNTGPTVAQQIAALEAKKEILLKKQQEGERKRINELAAKLDRMPREAGVDNIDQLIVLLRQRSKGTLGSIARTVSGNAKERVELSAEKWTELLARFKANPVTKTRTDIIAETGVHPQTLQNRLSKAGLVKSRKAAEVVAAPAAPVVPMTETANVTANVETPAVEAVAV